MEVYFSSRLNYIYSDEIYGDKIYTNWEFYYAGKNYKIPTIYEFPQGLVFDIICFLDNNEMSRYFNEYIPNPNTLKNKEIYTKTKKTFQEINFEDILINSKSTKGHWQSNSKIFAPWSTEKDDILVYLRKLYSFLSLSDSGFYCIRTSVTFPSNIKVPLKSLSIKLRPSEEFFPIKKSINLVIGENTHGQMINFIHPINQLKYKLHVHSLEVVDYKNFFSDSLSFFNPISYCVKIDYEIEPALSNGERILMKQLNIEKQQINSKINNYIILGGSIGSSTLYKDINTRLGIHGFPLYTDILDFCDILQKEIVLSIEGIYYPTHKRQEFDFFFPQTKENNI